MPHDGAFHLHVFRVEEGLGNACLLILPDGRRAIVDWGTQDPDAINRALELAPEGFAFIAATHAHQDHVLGIERLLVACHESSRRVGYLTFPASTLHKPNASLTSARERARELNIDSFAVTVQSIPGTGQHTQPLARDEDRSWSLVLLAPSCIVAGSGEMSGYRRGAVPGNETSFVLLFRYHDARAGVGLGTALLPGDATRATLQQARDAARREGLAVENQAMVVPHHGSAYNLPDWLLEASHGVAVVSGREDSEHHPSQTSLTKLSARCRSAEESRLFCTSYALCCRRKFGALADDHEEHWTQPGACFGDVTIRLTHDEPAQLIASSAPGFERRRFGHCGNVGVGVA